MSNLTVWDVLQYVESLAPPGLAEDWDNVGLLLGDPQASAHKVMTCLTLTPDVAGEAVQANVDLVVTHHPILFRAVKRLTTENVEGRMLLELIRADVAVYSPHTAFDNGAGGINQWLAEALQLTQITPLRPQLETPEQGSGRVGHWERPLTWEEFHRQIQTCLKLSQYQFVPSCKPEVRRVGVACGAAGEFLRDAHREDCDVFITGETRFHTCLEARTWDIGLVLLGHYASERPALEWLADRLANEFPSLEVWASREETDPLSFIGESM